MNITHVLFSIIAQVSPTPPAGPGSVPAEAVALVSPSPLVMSTPLPIPTPPPEVLEPNFAVRLLEFVGKGGPVMIPMIMLAFLVVVLIVERYLYLRQINRGSVGFTKNFFDLWNSGQIEKASTLAQENEGPQALSQGGASHAQRLAEFGLGRESIAGLEGPANNLRDDLLGYLFAQIAAALHSAQLHARDLIFV